MPLPDGLVAFYGDDFTGSAAVMEVLAFAGLPTVLFLDVADAAAPGRLRRLSRHRHRRRGAVAEPGLDGAASAAGLRRPLPSSARRSRTTRSARPSTPPAGRLDRPGHRPRPAAARRRLAPLVVAAPRSGATGFGNLFAAATAAVHRLDRHPTMSRHPMTPMDEADVRRHLARRPTGRSARRPHRPRSGEGEAALARVSRRGPRSSRSTSSTAELAEAGRLIWEDRGDRLWRRLPGRRIRAGRALAAAGLIGRPRGAGAGAGDRRGASGSCSPVTAGRSVCARARLRAPRVDATGVDDRAWGGEIGARLRGVAGRWRPDRCRHRQGADDPRSPASRRSDTAATRRRTSASAPAWHCAAQIPAARLTRARLRRRHLGLRPASSGLRAEGCRRRSRGRRFSAHGEDIGLEVSLKGGQMGEPGLFPADQGRGRVGAIDPLIRLRRSARSAASSGSPRSSRSNSAGASPERHLVP